MYKTEDEVAKKAEKISQKKDLSADELREEYEFLKNAYHTLLGDAKFLTRISDRLQNRLNGINENLVRKTLVLEETRELVLKRNRELQDIQLNLEEKVARRTRDLEKAYHDLLVANEELDNFVYKASHDIRGPIARIIGLCNVALLECRENKALDYFQMLQVNARRMNNLLERLLYINNLKDSKPVWKSVSISECIRDATNDVSGLAENGKIDFKIKTPREDYIITDEDILSILMKNILEFAVSHISLHEPERVIVTKCVREEDNLQIYIVYKGLVIPEKQVPLIFDMFHRITNNYDSTAMELYTANQAAQKLNGHVELIASTRDETIFSIFIPSAPDEDKGRLSRKKASKKKK